jgi:transcriptional regulator with XRE-family HTH domain
VLTSCRLVGSVPVPVRQLESEPDQMLNITLAKRRRTELGLTLAQVGELVGVGRDVIHNWESGKREPRNTESLRRYARALQVEAGELVAEPENEAVSG